MCIKSIEYVACLRPRIYIFCFIVVVRHCFVVDWAIWYCLKIMLESIYLFDHMMIECVRARTLYMQHAHTTLVLKTKLVWGTTYFCIIIITSSGTSFILQYSVPLIDHRDGNLMYMAIDIYMRAINFDKIRLPTKWKNDTFVVQKLKLFRNWFHILTQGYFVIYALQMHSNFSEFSGGPTI